MNSNKKLMLMQDKSYFVVFIIISIYLVGACNSEQKKPKNDSIVNASNTNNSMLIVDNSNRNIISDVPKNYQYCCDSNYNVNFKVNLEYDLGNSIDSFCLVLIGKCHPHKEQWDSSFTVNDIQFYKVIKNRLERIKIQSDSFPDHFHLSELEVFNYKNQDFSDFISNRINLKDYNLDNYPDLSIYCRGNSGSGGEIYFTWIYDSKKEYYRFNTLLSSANIGSIDSENKTITMCWKSGWCDHNVWLYKVQKDNFKLIKKTSSHSVTDSTGNVDCVEEINYYKNVAQ